MLIPILWLNERTVLSVLVFGLPKNQVLMDSNRVAVELQ